MEFLTNLLASEQVQTAILTVLGLALTFIANRAAGAFTAATGIRIEEKHQRALHEAIMTGVESAMVYGPEAGLGTFKAHVVAHLKTSVPDALKALTPGDGVLDRLIERYSREALAKLGEPK